MATISKISQYTDIAHVQKINEIIDAINTFSNKEEYELPTATNDSLGGVIVGSNISLETNGRISIDKEDVINALGYTPADIESEIELVPASKTSLGVVKIGSNIDVNDNGTISISKSNISNALGFEPKDYKSFSGATEEADGEEGLVPAPLAGNNNRFLSSDGTWKSVNVDLSSVLSKEDVINLIYPIGSIYLSFSDTSPQTLFGIGQWEKLSGGRVLLTEGSSDYGEDFTVEEIGGEANHVLTEEELPEHSHTGTTDNSGAHTHSRGTMNIRGSFYADDSMRGKVEPYKKPSGAFYPGETIDRDITSGDSGGYDGGTLEFDASKNWTGETSSNGNHTHTLDISGGGSGQAHNNMPPYIVCFMWRRIS